MAGSKTANRTVLTETQARQGFRDRPVLLVLIASTALVCIGFAILYFYYLP